MPDRALFELLPALIGRLPMAPLGAFPTPVDALPAVEESVRAHSGALYVKRDDVSSPFFGGNKVRPLEVFFGAAKKSGATHVFSTGAFGSNHAVAAIVHAPRAGLGAGAILYPQPPSVEALENLKATVALGARFVALPHWSALPFGIGFVTRSERSRGHRPFVMVPGGATPEGALGYVNAALELAVQVECGLLPRPVRVVVAGGSGCTTAGLLAGFALAARLGVGFSEDSRNPAPEILSVRVTPWPVTSAVRLARLAARASALVATLSGDPALGSRATTLARRLRVDGRFLGQGYGHATRAGKDAVDLFRRVGAPLLDTTYSAKAAAGLLQSLREHDDGPVVYWATRSAVPPPAAMLPAGTAPRVVRWVERTTRLLEAERREKLPIFSNF